MSMFPVIGRLGRAGLIVPILIGMGAAQAQTPAPPAASAPAPKLQFESVFSAYRPFADEPIAPWRQVNDTVRQIGGWRSYAREAQQSQPGSAPAPASAASAPAAGDHRGHQGGKP